ncbi:lytic transglycosylase domain-containing protein, partial [Klebsiella pneumoniae]|nr:lytic transglycosylase domain-containing protein [Klebsiella pneumoniae]
AVQALQPQESAPDFTYQQELYATAQAKLTQVLKAREAHAGGGVVQNDETTQKSFSAYSANPELLGDYVNNVLYQKQRFG